jgi:hypothetical protein
VIGFLSDQSSFHQAWAAPGSRTKPAVKPSSKESKIFDRMSDPHHFVVALRPAKTRSLKTFSVIARSVRDEAIQSGASTGLLRLWLAMTALFLRQSRDACLP